MAKETWQVRFNDSILGVRVFARRRGRGSWIPGAQLPKHVQTFLALGPFNGKGGSWVMDRDEFPNVEAVRQKGTEIRWQRSRWLQGIARIDAPLKPRKPEKIPRGVPAIRSLADLCAHFGASSPLQLNRCIYKDTECGASISLYFDDGKPLHNGSDPRWERLTRRSTIRGFTIQTIVEGSDAEVCSDEFLLPVTVASVGDWVAEMEREAERLWDEANLN